MVRAMTTPLAPKPKRGRPARLSRDAIAGAALDLGVTRLSMNALAEHLGVAKSSLYGWVSSREELLGLVSNVVMERCLPTDDPVDGDWRTWLADLAWCMRRELLAVPGYAAYVAGPHEHHSGAFGQLRERVVEVFENAGLEPEIAVQNWYIFSRSVINWLPLEQQARDRNEPAPRFDLLLQVLLRGLPAC
jgi:AcrR family transcriptional regulator